LKSNFKVSKPKKEKIIKSENTGEKSIDNDFTDLWSFRSKKRQKLS